jgi:hypothetical protein
VIFQIKVQVKNQKVNALFDRGSQCNLVSETFFDELGLETYDLDPNWILENVCKCCK